MSSTIALWGRYLAIAGTHQLDLPVVTFVYPLVGMPADAAVPGSVTDPTTSTAEGSPAKESTPSAPQPTAANEGTGTAPARLDRRSALAALAAIKLQTSPRFASKAVLNRIATGVLPGFRCPLPPSRMTLIVSAISRISTTMETAASTHGDFPVSTISSVLTAGGCGSMVDTRVSDWIART